jgi:hypothetical protein
VHHDQAIRAGGDSLSVPDGWELESEDTDSGWNVSVQSPATAFLLLSYHPEEDDPAYLADATIAALREDYPQLEAQNAVETIAGQPAIGHDINFFAFDLTNTCWTRCLRGPTGSLLVMCQCTDEELPDHGDTLKAICASVSIDEEAAEGEGD